MASKTARQALFTGGSLREALLWTRRALADNLSFSKDERARDMKIEAEVLVAHVAQCSRTALHSHPERMLDTRQSACLAELIGRRLAREPVAYLVGRREFYGLELEVDPRVLIPRPETELLVERAIVEATRRGGDVKIADVGTGSGAIAIALSKHVLGAKVYATDISPEALDVAARNCMLHGVARQVTLLRGDLLAALPERVQIVVANLPYVTADEMANLEPEVAACEPRLALFGGDDGLDHYTRLLAQAAAYLSPDAVLILEIAPHQVERLRVATFELFPTAKLGIDKDLAGRDRVFWASLP